MQLFNKASNYKYHSDKNPQDYVSKDVEYIYDNVKIIKEDYNKQDKRIIRLEEYDYINQNEFNKINIELNKQKKINHKNEVRIATLEFHQRHTIKRLKQRIEKLENEKKEKKTNKNNTKTIKNNLELNKLTAQIYDFNIRISELESSESNRGQIYDNNIYDIINELYERFQGVYHVIKEHKLSINNIIEKIIDELHVINNRNKELIHDQDIFKRVIIHNIEEQIDSLYNKLNDYCNKIYKKNKKNNKKNNKKLEYLSESLVLLHNNFENEKEIQHEFYNNHDIITNNFTLINNHIIRRIDVLDNMVDNIVNGSPQCKQGKDIAVSVVESCLNEENHNEQSNINYKNNSIIDARKNLLEIESIKYMNDKNFTNEDSFINEDHYNNLIDYLDIDTECSCTPKHFINKYIIPRVTCDYEEDAIELETMKSLDEQELDIYFNNENLNCKIDNNENDEDFQLVNSYEDDDCVNYD